MTGRQQASNTEREEVNRSYHPASTSLMDMDGKTLEEMFKKKIRTCQVWWHIPLTHDRSLHVAVLRRCPTCCRSTGLAWFGDHKGKTLWHSELGIPRLTIPLLGNHPQSFPGTSKHIQECWSQEGGGCSTGPHLNHTT